MLQIDKWADSKSGHIAMLAKWFAADADAFYSYFEYEKNNKFFAEFLSDKDIDQWLKLYRQHKNLFRRLIAIFKEVGGIGDIFATLLELLFNTSGKKTGSTNKNQNVDPVEFFKASFLKIAEIAKTDQNIALELEKIKKLFQDDIHMSITGDDDEEEIERIYNIVRRKQEFLFLIFIYAPCYLLYAEHPTRLYRKARQGDIKALDKLLRLDKFLIRDPQINRHIPRAYYKNDYKRSNVLFKAVKSSPRKQSREKVVMTQAAIISIISELMGHRLSSYEIQQLVLAAANDKREDESQFSKFQSLRAFDKQIQRLRNQFDIPAIFNLDKK